MIEDNKEELTVCAEDEFKILPLIQQKPDAKVEFFNGNGVAVGTLDFNTDELRFEGNANESARVFINVLKNFWAFDCKKAYEQGHQDKSHD